MKDKIIRWIGQHAATVIFIFAACDPFKEDSPPLPVVNEAATDYYILPNTSAVIDLKALVNSSFTNAIIKVSENPIRGKLTKLDDFLLKYDPQTNFMEGIDQFNISFNNNGTILKTAAITIHMRNDTDDFPCSIYTVEDNAFTNPDSLVAIKFLYNDRICGFDKNKIQISIHSQPKNGEAKLVGDDIIYSPTQGFIGRDSLIYKITADNNLLTADNALQRDSYGIISIQVGAPLDYDGRWTIINQWIFDARSIYFIDEKTGFAIGNGTLLKTTDGGVKWKSTIPYDEGFYYDVADIHFPDINNGFAAYTKYDSLHFPVEGGILKTVNGGEAWEKQPFVNGLISIHFISLSTGFASRNNNAFGIYKTSDEGRTWKWVSESVTKDIVVVNSTTGYAAYSDEFGDVVINKTIDGGDSWQRVPANFDLMHSFTNSGQSLFVVSSNDSGSANNATTMWRSADGVSWTISFEQEEIIPSDFSFSPLGALGMEVGYSIQNGKLGPAAVVSHNGGISWQYEKFNISDGSKYPFFRNMLFNSVSVPSERMAYVLATDGVGYPILLRYEVK